MPAWREARHAGRQARAHAQAERAEEEDHQFRRIDRNECYFCGGQDGLAWQWVAHNVEAMVCRKCRKKQGH